MSEGHAQATEGLTQDFTFEGKEYTLSAPFRVGTYKAMEKYLVSLRGDPIAIATEACKQAPQEHHATIWDQALKQVRSAKVVTADELSQFENSMHGLGWKFWYCLQDHHAEEFPDVDKAVAFLERVAEAKMLEEIQIKIALASGEDDLGNSSGPGPEEGTREANGNQPEAG